MDLKSIDKLLKHGVFSIPEYQRGYSWSKEQIQEFKDDLEDVEHVKEHYTGTITLIKIGDEKIGVTIYPKYDIVDGQQRLTTIHLFLISLYYRLKKLGKADEDIIRNVKYKGKTLLRLNNPANQEFFSYLLNEEDISKLSEIEPENKTQKNLIFARQYFEKYLERVKEKKALLLYNNLATKFKVNIFELNEEAEVGLIFETMNDRGLPLSDIDKIKNYLVYVCHRLNDNKLAKETNRRFGEVFRELMKIQSSNNITKIENQFLKNSYLVYTGDTKDLGDIHKKVKMNLIPKKVIHKNKDLFDTNDKLKEAKINDIKNFNSFLVKSSKEYVKILNQDFDNEEINVGLLRLKILNKLDIFVPILLSVATNPKFKTHYLVTIIEILEIFAVRIYSIGNKKSNTGLTALNDIAYKIRKNKINFTDIKKEIRSLLSKNISNNEFKNAIVNETAYNKLDSDTIKYFLYEYELYRTKENNSAFKLPNLKTFFKTKGFSIEHIHPQTPIPNGKQLTSVHMFGNLVLSKTNGQLDNKGFNSKKKIYANSELTSERDIADYDEWNDKIIIQRGKILAKFGMERWKN